MPLPNWTTTECLVIAAGSESLYIVPEIRENTVVAGETEDNGHVYDDIRAV